MSSLTCAAIIFIIGLSAGKVSGGQTASSVASGSRPMSRVQTESSADYWQTLAVKRLAGWRHAELQRNHARGQLRALRRVVWHLRALKRPGWRPKVDDCLSELIWRESRWNVHATNPTTGAYGLPQALPGEKMASAGPNWRHDAATQIRWMVGYVQRYGGSCGALSFQKAHGYY